MIRLRFLVPDSIRVYRRPFPYFIGMTSLGEETLGSMLKLMEQRNEWDLVKTDFYEQYELGWPKGQTPTGLEQFDAPFFLQAMRDQMEDIFGVCFAPRITWTLHKLTKGQSIRIHNDLSKGEETHRLIVNLNRGWRDSQGGFFMTFSSKNAQDIDRILRPLNGSVIGFAIGENSNHAVSQVLEGQRFSIVYSLYGQT